MIISTDAIMDCINKPQKLQIVQTVQELGKCTAKELQEIIKDIPQATMYRLLENLVNDNILEICEEVKVKALIKKVYTISSEWLHFQNTMISENDGETYFKMFSIFTMKLAKEFRNYAKQDNIDIANDGSGFNAVTIYASNEELVELNKKMNEILKEYRAKKISNTSEQKSHTFATILTPPKKGCDE